MNPRTDRANRVLLTLFSLLILAAGIAGLMVSFGSIQAIRASAKVKFPAVPPWLLPAVVAGSIVLASLGLWWVVAQTRLDRVARLELEKDPSLGGTTLMCRALLDAVGAEVADISGVRRASARMIGRTRRPQTSVEDPSRTDRRPRCAPRSDRNSGDRARTRGPGNRPAGKGGIHRRRQLPPASGLIHSRTGD